MSGFEEVESCSRAVCSQPPKMERLAGEEKEKAPRLTRQLAAENGSQRSGITKNSQLCSGNNGRYLMSRLRFPRSAIRVPLRFGI